MNPREELVSLLRGHFATHVLIYLAECGATERMRQGAFSVRSFPTLTNQPALNAIFRYLQCLGLLQPVSGTGEFITTPLGGSVLSRVGAFLILDSYRDYFEPCRNCSTGLLPQQ